MTPAARNRVYGLLVAVVVFGVDRLVKSFVINALHLREVGEVYLLPFFRFTYAENYGVSLSMLRADSMEMRFALIALTGVIALVVLAWMMRERRFWDIFALGLILGGAAGNIRDRWSLGFVIDYADFHLGRWTPFVFNFADAAITFGVVIILARSLFLREKRSASEPAGTGPENPSNEQAAEIH